MIGLEYILEVFKTNANQLANDLEVSRYTIYDWLKERRKIPEKRLEQLSKHFKIPKHFFISKELKPSEKIEIQRVYIQQNASHEEYEDIFIDDEGNEHIVKRYYSPEQDLDRFLSEEQLIHQTLERVEKVVRHIEWQNDNLDLINDFLDIIESFNIRKRNMLSRTVNYLSYYTEDSVGFDTTMNDDLVKKFDEIYEMINKRK
ncbi:hypothetical protein [Bacillus litorisediminis]|uniref:hypothetical protein n=1 Tax=Bacillus litorisediminis TaxID=2922713 RepID=UPI001FAEED98|nr:hypothetical protein [Bacillus litorisediminis]